MQKPFDEIKNELKNSFDNKLVDKLFEYFKKIKENYYIGKYEPSELNAGKFSEIIIRMLQNYTNADHKFTPLNKRISNIDDEIRKLENLPSSSFHESLRIHIPRVVKVIYDIRNRRGVGHISGDINPNFPDSLFVVTCCDWITVELIRLFYSTNLEKAQKMVEGLIQRRNPIVYVIDDFRRVLEPSLSFSDKVLVILNHEYPNKVIDRDLYKWTEHTNFSVFRSTVLNPLHKDAKIHWKNAECQILPPGIKYVEEKVLSEKKS